MPSTFTQNLAIEKPGTGEQANVWGITVNNNFDRYDLAMKGSIALQVSSSPILDVSPGGTSPPAACPVILWNGAQTGTPPGVVTISPNTRQSLYLMRNQTTADIQFQQSAGGANFVLKTGYDAIIYSDGGGGSANTWQGLANPQFNNVLIQGNVQVQGSVTGTLAVANLAATGWISIGSPTSVPDPLTINGMLSPAYGQIRLVYGSYGVIIRNDGASFHILTTASGSPYGNWATGTGGVTLYGLYMDLATRTFGLAGWAPNPAWGLQVPSVHTGTALVDGLVTATTVQAGTGVNNVTGNRNLFRNAENYIIALEYNASTLTWIGTDSAARFLVSRGDGVTLFTIDTSGNGGFIGALAVTGTVTATVASGNGFSTNGSISVGGSISATGNISTGAGGTVTASTVSASSISATGGITANSLTVRPGGTGVQFADNTIQTTAATAPPPPPAYAVAPHGVTRVTNNNYTNNTGVLMWVTIALNLFAGSNGAAMVGASFGAAPSITVGYGAVGASPGSSDTWLNFCFPVPAGYIYQISTSSAPFNINYATEWY